MHKNLLAISALLLVAVAMPATAIDKGDPARGEELSSTCASCHSASGNSTNPQFPRLAGQYADYMVKALQEYKSGQRKNAIMNGIAAGLSKRDMEDLAAYFSRQRGDLYQVEAY